MKRIKWQYKIFTVNFGIFEIKFHLKKAANCPRLLSNVHFQIPITQAASSPLPLPQNQSRKVICI